MRYLLLAVPLLLAGCPPQPMGQPYSPNLEFNWNYLQHLGDKVLVGADAADATVDVTLTNNATGQKQHVALAGAKGEVTLDAATLPGYDASAGVQTFDVAMEMSWRGSQRTRSTTTFLLTSDPDARLLPNAPPEFPLYPQTPAPGQPAFTPGGQPLGILSSPGPEHWRSADSTVGPEAYVQHLIEAWPIASPVVTSAPVGRDGITLPDYLKDMPATTALVRYEVRAKFPKYVLLDAQAPNGRATVLAPTGLAITLTRTDPADLVSLKAF
ncbi:MAG: hypothetical protein JWM80_5465 [Cyanobacteria bacterium RYN_339]|nr:hypothetical protein [Cyanobacteria bacterium RYN_339]